MQTILGANGQIGQELARELKRNYTSDIRLVSRNPVKVNDTDSLFPANLLDVERTKEAVRGSEIAYLTVGLPMNTEMWAEQFPVMMRNVIDACKEHQTKLVFFDNTYMYPQNEKPLPEETEFAPVGEKGEIRGDIATMLLDEITSGNLEALICRAPEFYGPGKTQSVTNSMIFENIRQGKKLQVLLNDEVLRTLIWSPDASKAMALVGNTPDAYHQTWHLPCDDNRLTYKQFIALASGIYGQELEYTILSRSFIEKESTSSKLFQELQELLPRYDKDNIFDSTKFKYRFPEFTVTTYREGIEQIKKEQKTSSGLKSEV